MVSASSVTASRYEKMNWNDLAKEVHRDAVDKGEWDKPRTLDDVICDCLVHPQSTACDC